MNNEILRLNTVLHLAVKTIKTAILQSQLRAAKNVNREQLSLYFGIGRYISEHSRTGYWGTGAIETISEQLQRELPGLKGFSETNMKKMRIFYEQWSNLLNRSLAANDLEGEVIRQPIADDIPCTDNSQSVVSELCEIDYNALEALNRSPLAHELEYEEFIH